MFLRLAQGWNNESYSAAAAFLESTFNHSQVCPGTVLECGSGLTSLLLAYVRTQRRKQVFSLENDPGWLASTRSKLAEYGFHTDFLLHTALVDYGSFTWYDVSALPEECRDIGLVICDGPPGDTPGGRYGLLPLMIDRMRPDCLILMDDTSRAQEEAIVERWRREFGIVVREESASFSVLQLPAAAGRQAI